MMESKLLLYLLEPGKTVKEISVCANHKISTIDSLFNSVNGNIYLYDGITLEPDCPFSCYNIKSEAIIVALPNSDSTVSYWVSQSRDTESLKNRILGSLYPSIQTEKARMIDMMHLKIDDHPKLFRKFYKIQKENSLFPADLTEDFFEMHGKAMKNGRPLPSLWP